jgi:tetratricopeptide (TPR) repeat protein
MDMKNSQNNKVVLFPGMVEKIIERAHDAAELSRYAEANELFEQALAYIDGDEYMLSVYAHSLYEVKNYARAKEICEDLLALQPKFYFEVMELYLTICMQMKEFQQVDKIIQTLFEQNIIPVDQQEKFQRIQRLNERIALNKQRLEQDEVEPQFTEEQFDVDQFLELSVTEQLMRVQQFSELNIRPYTHFFKAIIEEETVHPFIQSLLLILLVEQEVSIEISVAKMGMKKQINPAEYPLPTKLPQFKQIYSMLAEEFDQNPTVWEMLQQVLSKHAIVAYPFEWTPYQSENVANTYVQYVNSMFGHMGEYDYDIMDTIQLLDKLSELQ